jgi:hypothetical protein
MLTKTEQVWRHLLVNAANGKRRWRSLADLASELLMTVSTTHAALARPREVGAVIINPGGGVVCIDPGKLEICWAGRRRLKSDIIRRFNVATSAPETEALLGGDPDSLILGGHGAAIAARGKNTISDYSTVLVYGDPSILTPDPAGPTEVIALQPDRLLARYGRTTPLAQAWVDLFCLPNWQAARFTHYMIGDVFVE